MASVIAWILTHKLLLFLSAAAVAFGISTIVLGVDNSRLKSDLEDARANSTTTTTLASTTTTSPTTTTTTTEAPDDMSKYRLPSTVKPLVYDLYLYPDLDTGLFRGKASVSLQIFAETDKIVLHSNLLNIDSVSTNSELGRFALDANYELLTITKPDYSNFNAGNATVEIDFNGDMKNRIVGLYTSSYTTSTGESSG